MYIGAVVPWDDFHQPDTSGITWPRLLLLGVLVLLFRRIPSTLALYKFMPKCCKNWREALFMGYFGPIGRFDLRQPRFFPDGCIDYN
jgi:NhaP-type Na+/H+ or K+/H+ antiporter